MSEFRQDREEEKSGPGLGTVLAIGAGVAGLVRLGLWYLEKEEHDYSETRNTQLKQCNDDFVSAEDLLNSGSLKPGDMIEIKRFFFQHWVLYIDDGLVIHVNAKLTIVIDRLLDVAGNCTCRVNLLEQKAKELKLKRNGTRQAIVDHSLTLVGQVVPYDICESNCEHFVTECFYGTVFSCQQETLEQHSGARFFAKVGARSATSHMSPARVNRM